MESRTDSKQPEAAEDEQDADSFSSLASKWASSTGMPGLPNIANSSSRCKRTFWTLLLLAGMTMMAVQIVQVVMKFYTYPIRVTRRSEIQMPADFPAVTVCNRNAARLSAVNAVMSARKRRDVQPSPSKEELNRLTSRMYANSSDVKNSSTATWSGVSRSAGVTYTYLDFYNSLNSRTKIKVGYNISQMLVECLFETFYCSERNFTRWLHPLFGNCFTFNAAAKAAAQMRQPGHLNGLSLTLYVDQSEYVGSVSQAAGVIVVVHEPRQQPFPEDKGINVAPGLQTNVEVKRLYIKRLPQPYSDNCQIDYATANAKRNMYSVNSFYSLPNVNYSSLACLKTCTQRLVQQHCGCSSPKLPAIGVANSSAAGGRVCRYEFNATAFSISDTAKCAIRVEIMSYSSCQSMCQQQCDEIVYGTKTTEASWPSRSYEDDAYMQATAYSPEAKAKAANSSMKAGDFMRENYAKVVVFYADSVLETRVSSPDYQLVDLLSDMGGQVGLWLGLSILTLFEVVEMAGDLLALGFARMTMSRQLRVNRVDAGDNLHLSTKADS